MKEMRLPVNPPVLPMLAKRVSDLPDGTGWIFEPKWDGFRTLIFRDGDDVFIQSRDEKPLNRYFPELVDTLKAQLPKRCVLDGEIVIAGDEGLEFETLQMRLHPAASRVNKLAVETPASVVFFDLLCEGDRSLHGELLDGGSGAMEGAIVGKDSASRNPAGSSNGGRHSVPLQSQARMPVPGGFARFSGRSSGCAPTWSTRVVGR